MRSGGRQRPKVGTATRWRIPALVAAALLAVPMVGSASATPRSAWRKLAAAPTTPAGAVRVGPVPAARVVGGIVGLRPRNPAGLARVATAVSTPGNSRYHRYLAPGRLDAAFGPAPAAARSVEHYLETHGVRVTGRSADGLLVHFRGPAGDVAAAFGTRLAAFRSAGSDAIANTAPLHVPASLGGAVQAVVGLDTLARPRPALEGAGAAPAAACPAAAALTADGGAWTDTQIAAAYGADPLLRAGSDGAGSTVALFELEPYSAPDIKAFDACYFGTAAAATMARRVVEVPVDGGVPTGSGSGESALDAEMVSALAPGARIEVYEAPPTTTGYLDEWNAIVQDDTAATVSTSWSLTACEAQMQTQAPGVTQLEDTLFEEAAAQGQTVLAAAGDSGSDACAAGAGAPTPPDLSVSDPASQPFVTGVGGTSLLTASDPPEEQVWNDGAGNGAGGGGISSVWPAPGWQLHASVPGLLPPTVIARAAAAGGGRCGAAGACREVPDVSATADEDRGVTIRSGGAWAVVGGTSAAAPLWAALLADTDSTPTCRLTGGVGFADPSLYAIASVPAEYAASFNDVATGDNDNFGANAGLFTAGRGYDMATGLGSPRLTGAGGARGLAYYLCTPPSPERPTVTALSPPVTAATGGPVLLTVAGSGFVSHGAPDVAGVSVGSVEASPFSVINDTTLTVTVPSAPAGAYDVTVTLIGGRTSAPSAASRLTVEADGGTPAPVLAAVSPSGGNESGGTVVRVYGTGFGTSPAVTIGGLPATVLSASDSELTAAVPPYRAGATDCVTGTDPTTDVCQTQVQVTTGGGISPEAPILPEAPNGSATGNGTETVAATTEYDYFPTPAVTGLTYDDPSQAYASQEGISFVSHASNLVTVTGVGFGALGLEWFDVGRPGSSASVDADFLELSPTQAEVVLPSIPLQARQVVDRLAVQTLASPNQSDLASWREPSAGVPVTYAPVPRLRSLTTPSGRRIGPDSGGTTITVTGTGIEDGPFLAFESPSALGLGSDYNPLPDPHAPTTRVRFVTTAQTPGLDQADVCTSSGCAGDREQCVPGICQIEFGFTNAPTFAFYPPGAPVVRSVSPRRGAAGTLITILGRNLSIPEEVMIGAHRIPARLLSNPPVGNNGLVDPSEIQLTVPGALPLGRALPVRVATAESEGTRPRSALTRARRGVTFTRTGRRAGVG